MSAVSLVAAACWDHIVINDTRSLLFTALPKYINAPTIHWTVLMTLSSRDGLVSVGCTIFFLAPYSIGRLL